MTLDIIRTFSFGHESDVINKSDSDFKYKLFEAFDNASPGLVDMQESWTKRFIASKIPLSILAAFDDNLKEIHKMQQVRRTVPNHAETITGAANKTEC
jgi:hypothetical protein